MNASLNAIVPLLILIFMGYASRKFNILHSGDERVLSSYVYYFALPSLFFVSISSIKFNRDILLFIMAGITPLLILISIYSIIYLIFRVKRDLFYLLSLSTIFGSLAFFGIPFIIFFMPSAERLAALFAGMVSIVGVTITITFLEIHRHGGRTWENVRRVIKKLSVNPLILSIIAGILFSMLGISLPSILYTPLHMLGRSTSVVAIFMLGVFLYGRKFGNLKLAFGLSMLRMALLPALTFIVAKAMMLSNVEMTVSVLMNAMPLAVSMIVLSQRYQFREETFASIILISSLGAIIYLTLWMYVIT